MIALILFWLFVFGIIYTYFGYAVLLYCVARLKPGSPKYQQTVPFVTLLIAAYNEQDIIAEKIENSLKLEYPHEKLQILIAADGSDDQTAQIVKSFQEKGVELSFSPERRGKMAAINHAMLKAKGDVIVFSDANNMYRTDTITELVLPFSDPTIGVVSGAKRIIQGDGVLGESEGLYWKFESFIKKQETRLGCMVGGMAGEILAIRKELFQPVPSHIINDDFHIALQVIRPGKRIVYAPNAHSYERVALSSRDEMTRRIRMNSGLFQSMVMAAKLIPFQRLLLWWQIISHKFLRLFVPFGMIGALLTNLWIVLYPYPAEGNNFWLLTPPWGLALFVSQCLFYLLAWLGNRMENSGRMSKIFYLPTFLVNSNLAVFLGVYRFLTGERTVLWQRVARR